MSLCMDGRLPSGRRAVLMRHINGCDTCGQVWRELLAARESAMELPAYRVGSDFRDGLQARIRAGEGAPDAVYRDPIPSLTKVRYVLTGAAAAAVLLVTFRLAVTPETPVELVPNTSNELAEARGGSEPDRIAKPSVAEPVTTEPAPADRPSGLKPRTRLAPVMGTVVGSESGAGAEAFPSGAWALATDAEGATWAQVNEFTLAKTSAEYTAGRVQKLRRMLRSERNRTLPKAWRDLETAVCELRSAVGVLRVLEDKRIVELQGSLRDELVQAERVFETVLNPKATWTVRRDALVGLEKMNLERVEKPEHLRVPCCRTFEELLHELEELRCVPGAGRIFQFSTIEPPSPFGVVEIRRKRGAQKQMILLRLHTRSR